MTEEQKIYIRGVKSRGSEVIKELTDLGGENKYLYDGEGSDRLYFIQHEGVIEWIHSNDEMAKIIMDNYKEIKLPEKWKDGDLLEHTDDDGYTDYAVYKETEEFNEYTQPYCILTYVCVNRHIYGINTILNKDNWKLASDEEHKKFYDLLHTHGKDWDAEKKQLIDLKWKPKEGDDYWTVIVGITIYKLKLTWIGSGTDKIRYELGNCFKTKEEAEAMIEKVKKLLKDKL